MSPDERKELERELAALRRKCYKKNGEQKARVIPSHLKRIEAIEKLLAEDPAVSEEMAVEEGEQLTMDNGEFGGDESEGQQEPESEDDSTVETMDDTVTPEQRVKALASLPESRLPKAMMVVLLEAKEGVAGNFDEYERSSYIDDLGRFDALAESTRGAFDCLVRDLEKAMTAFLEVGREAETQ